MCVAWIAAWNVYSFMDSGHAAASAAGQQDALAVRVCPAQGARQRGEPQRGLRNPTRSPARAMQLTSNPKCAQTAIHLSTFLYGMAFVWCETTATEPFVLRMLFPLLTTLTTRSKPGWKGDEE
eukprot:1873359-Amphidinium_carterae.1